MDIRSLVADDAFSLNVFGFQIDQGPPSPQGQEQFATSPTERVLLGTATSTEVPPQTISFVTATPAEAPNLKMSKCSAGRFNTDHWDIFNGCEITLQLSLDGPVNVNFAMTVAAETYHGEVAAAQISLSVNGHSLVKGYKDQNASWHEVSWVLPENLLKGGENTITVSINLSPDTLAYWLQSVTVSSQAVQIDAYYYWQEVFSGYAEPPGQENKTISIQTGTAKTDTEAYTFAETIGLEIQTKEGVPFANISAKLSTSFTATQGYTHSITISESETDSTSVTIVPTDGPVTFQFWQVCVEFDSNGQSINQLVGDPIIQTQYPPGANAQSTLQVVSRSGS